MTIILNGTTGVTFPDGTTQTDGIATPVPIADGGTGSATAADARTALGLAIGTDVLAPNGSGANLTALNANNIASGTLAVARGGTGTTSTTFCNLATNVTGTLPVANGGTGTATPSLVGGTNITISGTWPNQTVTAAGGGVTSLNGQTGAITNTDLGAIGSYITSAYCVTSPANSDNATSVAAGSTTSGSNLRYNTTDAYGSVTYYTGTGEGGTTGTNKAYPRGGTTLSGTWRCITGCTVYTYNAGCSIYSQWKSGLWVRIS